MAKMKANRDRTNRTAVGEAPAADGFAASRQSHFDDVMLSWRRERPNDDLTAMLLGICLTRIGRLLDADYDRLCKRNFDVSGAEMRLLLALRRAGHPFARRPTDLFRSLLITSGAITKQVDRLVSKELAAREHDPLHAGGFLIRLTQKGVKLANSAVELMRDHSLLQEVLQDMDPAVVKQGVAFNEALAREVERAFTRRD